MRTPQGHRKSIINTSKVKKNKDTYGIYPTKLASSTQQHKKVIELQINQLHSKIISNKSMFSTSKVQRRQKFVPKILKKLSKHQIYQSGRKFSKISMFSTLKV
jgi:hypothetical protein